MKKSVGRVLIGLAFIIAGLGFFGEIVGLWSNFTIFFKGWWTLFIIVPSLISLFTNRFSYTTLTFLIGGCLLLANQWYPNIITSRIVWTSILTLILIFIGLKIIFKNSVGATAVKIKACKTARNLQEVNAIFASQAVRYDDCDFTGAEVNAIFGSAIIDLSKATISSDCVIEANAIFGGIDIILGSNTNYKVLPTAIFGGVSDKRSSLNDSNMPTIFIEGTAIFGGVDIK